jgi:hypothetical protein
MDRAMADLEPHRSGKAAARRRLSLTVWLLGTLSVLGLIAFALTFGLVVNHGAINPQAVAPRAAKAADHPPERGEGGAVRGERGPKGDPGPPGPPGPPSLRLIRAQCTVTHCLVQCDRDEVLLSAHCGVTRAPAVFPSERSASCKGKRSGNDFVVAACAKLSVQ